MTPRYQVKVEMLFDVETESDGRELLGQIRMFGRELGAKRNGRTRFELNALAEIPPAETASTEPAPALTIDLTAGDPQ